MLKHSIGMCADSRQHCSLLARPSHLHPFNSKECWEQCCLIVELDDVAQLAGVGSAGEEEL